MTFHLISLALSGILSFADYITENIFSEKLKNNQKLVSFSAGVAISYIILNLFPEISSSALIDGKKIFLFALLGFVSLNLVEQYIYKGIGKTKNLLEYRKRVHISYFFIYNFLIGMVLVDFTSKGLAKALLFFLPFLLYIIIKILPEEFKFNDMPSKLAYSMAPILGTIFGIVYTSFVSSIFGSLVSFISGTLLYSVIRESLPSDKAERPLYFAVGITFYTLIILASWII